MLFIYKTLNINKINQSIKHFLFTDVKISKKQLINNDFSFYSLDLFIVESIESAN